MSLPFSFRQKTKIALLLFCIMACTVLIRLLEDRGLKNMGIAFTSIYSDRLIPATDLFQVSEHLMAKSQSFDLYLHQKHVDSFGIIHSNIIRHDFQIDSLLKRYQSTFLVNTEKGGLSELRKLINESRQLEHVILTNDRVLTVAQITGYENQLNFAYASMVKKISGLIKMQSKVGEELIQETQQLMVGSKVYSTFQFSLAIIIGILIVSILFTSNVIKVKAENFHLN